MFGAVDIDQGSHDTLTTQLETAMTTHEDRLGALVALLGECLDDVGHDEPAAVVAACHAIIARYEQGMKDERALFERFKKELGTMRAALTKDIAALTDHAVRLQRSDG